MQIDWWTLALQMINTIVLIWLLTRFLFRPIAAIIAERQSTIQQTLLDADNTRTEVARDRDAVQQVQDGLVEQRDAATKSTRQATAELREKLLREARLQADDIRLDGYQDAIRQQQKANTAIETHATQLAVDIARKLLQRLPDRCRVSGFIEAFGASLSTLPESTRAELGVDGPLELYSAHPLNKQEHSQLTQVVSQAVGHAVELDINVDSDLIAGFELQHTHCTVMNNFRADLMKINDELKHVTSTAREA